jgi:hypothetical protein
MKEIAKGQLTLSAKKEDFEKAFQDGEIVIQTWAWIGSFQMIFPFWQVRFSEIHNGERDYFCSAVPYGSHPMQDHWFGKEDILSIGLKWRVPSWDELNALCRKHSGEQSLYVRGLNSSRHEKGEWYCHLYPSYPEEKELVDMLNATGVDYHTVTRDNFEEKMKKILVKK